jgi:hypothetical protein
MRRSLVGLLLSGSVILTACGEKSQRSLAPRPQAAVSVPEPGPGCLSAGDIAIQIASVFPEGSDRTSAAAQFDAIVALIGPIEGGPDSAAAQARTIDLVAFTIAAYRAGTLIGGVSDDTRQRVAVLINGFLCFVGLPATFSPGALVGDGAATVLAPPTTTTDVVTDTKLAGLRVESGSISQPVLITVTRLPDSPGPLLTQLDQYPIFYEFHVTPEDAVVEPVVVAACQPESVLPPDPTRLRLAHNVPPFTPGSIEILPLAPAPFLDCSGAAIGALPTGNALFDLARAGWRRVGPVLTSLIAPTKLMAAPYFASSGVGGTTRNFSPFGAVDTLVIATANSPTSQSSPTGGAVPAPPSVAVRTPQGHPVTALPVSFAVTAGGGALTGAATSTDASGVATVGGWTLGSAPGLNTVGATVTPPHVGSGVAGSPVTFSATGTAEAVELEDCPPRLLGIGDDLSRAFYFPNYPGQTLKQVDLYLSSSALPKTPVPYTIQLVARSGGFNGPVLGTSTVTVTLRGITFQNVRTHFVFPGEPAVQRNGTVTFQFNVLSNPNRARLAFNIGAREGLWFRRDRCTLVETNDATGTLSTFRHQGVGARIIGAP